MASPFGPWPGSNYLGPAGAAGSLGVAGQTQKNAAPIGPAATVTFNTGNIVSTKTGLYLVCVALDVSCSAAAQQQFDLLMDGAVQDTKVSQSAAAAARLGMALSTTIQVTAGSTHTFGVQCTAAAGTAAIPNAGKATVAVVEF